MAADRQRPRPADEPDELALRAYFENARPDLDAPADLGALLRAKLDAARAAWPEVGLPAEAFVLSLAEKLPASELVAPALDALHTDDLYLACACARGDARALAKLDALCAPVVDRALRRLGPEAEQARDEVRQQVRQRLLAPRDATGGAASARIADYSGRSALGAWVRVVATREAVNLLRQPRRERPLEEEAMVQALGPEAEPELAYFKRLYRDEFKAAFREALEALSKRERTLLRQHALDGLSIDRLAALYGVHRATAARWVDAARRAVLDRTRRALAGKLRLRPAELDSIVRLIGSQLEVTLSPLLRDFNETDESAPPGPGDGKPTA